MKLFHTFIILVLSVGASSAPAMIRVLKYRPLTEVNRTSICIYAQHERNFKKENRTHPQNTKTAIVCRLSVSGEALPMAGSVTDRKLLSASVVQRYDFETLTKACVSFQKDLPKDYAIKALSGLTTECSTLEASQRVFPEYKPSLSKKS